MKHLIKTSLFLLAFLLPIIAVAQDFAVDGVYYKVDFWEDFVSVSDQGEGGALYTGNVTIPESVTNDGTTYPVTAIGYFAFKDCVELTGVNMPNTITEIGDHAFENCSSLIEVIIPASVTRIGKRAFAESGLMGIDIPKGVTEIDHWAFQDCPLITDVYCHVEDPSAIALGYNVFSLDGEDLTDRTLHVPAGSVDAYKVSNWSYYFSNIVAM